MSVDNKHISIHTPLAGSDRWPAGTSSLGSISIHTPLAGSDKAHSHGVPQQTDFNPHSPCGERLADFYTYWQGEEFQSTLPLRGATFHSRHSGHWASFFSPRQQISIHTPLAGSDGKQHGRDRHPSDFNPHSPCGERLGCCSFRVSANGNFNPHSPCGERHASNATRTRNEDFNPHSPCGERRMDALVERLVPTFQSTLPLRGATDNAKGPYNQVKISIHTPLAGSDETQVSWKHVLWNFNPHSPCGERLGRTAKPWGRS